jgi:hypothetical protein
MNGRALEKIEGLSLCAEHVQQLGGVSPLHILMEEK